MPATPEGIVSVSVQQLQLTLRLVTRPVSVLHGELQIYVVSE